MHTTTTLLTALTSATLALANPAPAPHPALVTAAPAIHPAAARLAGRQFRASDSDLSKSIECASSYASLVEGAPRETNTALARWLLSAAGPAAELITATVVDDSYTSLCDPSLTATLTPPASLSSAWSTYLEEASSWVTSVGPVASSVAQSCGGPISAFIEVLVISDAESCTKAVLGLVDALNGDDDATTTGSGTATVSPSRSRTTDAPEQSETAGAGGDDDDNNDGDDDSGNGNGDSDDGNGGSDDNGSDDPADAAETSTSTGGVPRETGFVGVAAAAAVAVVGVVAAL